VDTSHFTAWEARLAQVWRELLGTRDIRLEDNFFDLGGHTLLAMQAIERVAKDTAVRVTPRRYIFESLSQLAASYEREAGQAHVTHKPAPDRVQADHPSLDAAQASANPHPDTPIDSLGGMVRRWFKGLAR
jgi:hypothetical protein